jgi:hypothetical protein
MDLIGGAKVAALRRFVHTSMAIRFLPARILPSALDEPTALQHLPG